MLPSQGIVAKCDAICNICLSVLRGNGVGTKCLALSNGHGVVVEGNGIVVWCQSLSMTIAHEHGLYPFLYGCAFACALGDAYYHVGLDRKEVDKAMKALKEECAIVSPVRCKWAPAN